MISSLFRLKRNHTVETLETGCPSVGTASNAPGDINLHLGKHTLRLTKADAAFVAEAILDHINKPAGSPQGPAPQPAEHPHTIALREILKGSRPTGRWLIEDGDHCGECPSGYDEHDQSVEPPGCYWEEYDIDEQRRWLETVVCFCEEALATPAPSV